ncbi:MAG: hypothetical protein ACT4N2_05190 [Hyphomicrobium sp.]
MRITSILALGTLMAFGAAAPASANPAGAAPAIASATAVSDRGSGVESVHYKRKRHYHRNWRRSYGYYPRPYYRPYPYYGYSRPYYGRRYYGSPGFSLRFRL